MFSGNHNKIPITYGQTRTEGKNGMKLQNRNRAMLLAVVGGYVMYLAYEIMRNGLEG